MRRSALIDVILLNMVTTSSVSAAPQQVKCPDSIAANSVQIVDISKEWTPFVASPLYLHAAAPMNGPPEMRGDLADFTERRNKKEWSYTYQLDGAFPDGKWLQCTYGEYNQVTLSKKLPDDVRTCRITYRKGAKAGQNDINIDCR